MATPIETDVTGEEGERKGDRAEPLRSIWQLIRDPEHYNPRVRDAYAALCELSDSELAAVLKMRLPGTTAARSPNNAALLVAVEQILDRLLLSDENLSNEQVYQAVMLGETPRPPAIPNPEKELSKRVRRARKAGIKRMADIAVGRTPKDGPTVNATRFRQIARLVWMTENSGWLCNTHISRKAELLTEELAKLRDELGLRQAPGIDPADVAAVLRGDQGLVDKVEKLALLIGLIGYAEIDKNSVRKALTTLPF